MARIPIGMEHTSKVEGSLLTEFVCKSCKFQAIAAVKSKGEGRATAYGFIGGEAAKGRASGAAEDDFKKNAELLVSLAKCPSCSFVDEAAASAARSAATVQGLGIVAASVVIAFLSSGSHRASSGLAWVMPSIGIAVAVFQYEKSSWRWSEVGDRVKFLTDVIVEAAASEVGAATSAFRLGFVWGEAVAEAAITWPFASELRLGLLRVEPDGLSWLEQTDLEGVSPDEAEECALDNIGEASTADFIEVEPGVFRGDWNDQLAASRLALPELFEDLELTGTAVAFTASEDTLFLAGEDDHTGLERAFALSKADLKRVLDDEKSLAGRFTAHPWRLTDDGWQPWVVAEGHALRQAIAALEIDLGKRGWRPS